MIITFAKKDDKDEILDLWQEAFLEKREDIEPFVDEYFEYFVLLKSNETVCSMLSMMPVFINDEKGRYIYAVATKKEYQNRGYSSRLLEYVNEYININNEKFSVLVPANDSLFDFYKKRGYNTISCVEKNSIMCEKIAENDYEIKTIDEKEYYQKRSEKLKNYTLIKWSEKDLLNIKKIYGGEFLYIEKADALIFGFCYNQKFIAKEILCEKENLEYVFGAIKREFSPEEINYVTKGNEKFAMINKKEYNNPYFNLAID